LVSRATMQANSLIGAAEQGNWQEFGEAGSEAEIHRLLFIHCRHVPQPQKVG